MERLWLGKPAPPKRKKYERRKPTNTHGLPLYVEDKVRRVYNMLRSSAEALSELAEHDEDGFSSTLDERDQAVQNLGPARDELDFLVIGYNFLNFPALDWVVPMLEKCVSDLEDLLNEDDWACKKDAVVVHRIADELQRMLQ